MEQNRQAVITQGIFKVYGLRDDEKLDETKKKAIKNVEILVHQAFGCLADRYVKDDNSKGEFRVVASYSLVDKIRSLYYYI